MGFKPYLQDQLASFSALTLLVWGHMTCKNRPWYDLCVWWDVKPCSINQSIPPSCPKLSPISRKFVCSFICTY